MKTNISIELTESQRSHLNNIFTNKVDKKLITRKDLNALVDLMIQELLDNDVSNTKEVTDNIIENGYAHYFNDVRVSPEEYSLGIYAWLEKRKAEVA
jgi:hypothetical protein